MRRLVIALLTAAVLWFVMFSPWTAPRLNFWWMMTLSACVLTALAMPYLLAHRERVEWGREVALGLLIAVALWGVFWVGDKVSAWMFSFARPQVDSIYGMKADMPAWLIGLLLLCIIGPAEELFWRGYVQRSLSSRCEANLALVVTTLCYTLVHLPSWNFMLIMAALTCGLCWGLLYRFFPRHLAAIVISHAVWDAAVFVWFPI
ncbi:MAG: CPBP family intramembrane metalloprotease [Bacteroidaceae bacterium]|nr:CPBP family intramembrane metalloprotease [Bacteroidaceae bacterium]